MPANLVYQPPMAVAGDDLIDETGREAPGQSEDLGVVVARREVD